MSAMPFGRVEPEALFRYVLRLGDLSLVLGQRLGEWVGHAPALEEDLGLANVALDLIGQARLLLTYAGEIEGMRPRRGRDCLFARAGCNISTRCWRSSRTAILAKPSCGKC